MPPKQEWMAVFTVNGNRDNFALKVAEGTQVANIPQGDYYIYTPSGDSLVSLITEQIQSINICSNGNASYSNGLVTINLGAAVNIDWLDDDLRVILGFDSNVGGNTTYTANRSPRYTWRPSLGMAGCPVTPDGTVYAWRSTTKVQRSLTGAVRTVAGEDLYQATIEYRALPSADVLPDSNGSNYQDLYTFLLDSAHQGAVVRMVKDRDVHVSTSDYIDCVIGTEGDDVGEFSDFAKRRIKSYNGLFDVKIPVVKNM